MYRWVEYSLLYKLSIVCRRVEYSMQEDACQNYAMPGIMWAGGVEHMQGLDAMVLSPRPTCHSLAMMRKRD